MESLLERDALVASSLDECTRGINIFCVPLFEPLELCRVFFGELYSSSRSRPGHRKKSEMGLVININLNLRRDAFKFPLKGHEHPA